MPATKARRMWTAAEVALLSHTYAEGPSLELAQALGCNAEQVRHKAANMGLRKLVEGRFVVELQRPYGTVATRTAHPTRKQAQQALQTAIRAAGPDGFVVVLCNGKEITYEQLRGGRSQQVPGLRKNRRK